MSSLPIARMLGFEIRVHVSWAIILAVIAVTVAAQIEAMAPGVDAAVRWAVGAAIALSFLVSALAHELGHAVAARRAGMGGGPVEIYFFGGAAGPSTDARTPRDEIVVALAGPAVSLVLGIVLLGVALLGAAVGQGLAVAVGQIALVIGVMNLVLGLANLLPAFPLDGGRLVRAAAWARTGDRDRGLRVAGRVGRWLGLAMVALGIVIMVALREMVDGLMLSLGGWFLVSSARAVERGADVDALLEGIRVGDVMARDVTGVPEGLTLDTFAEQILEGAEQAVPVMHGPDLAGMLGARQLRRVRRDRWPAMRAGDVMAAADGLPTITPQTSLRSAFEELYRTGLDGLPVFEAGALSGIITRHTVAEAVRARATARGLVP